MNNFSFKIIANDSSEVTYAATCYFLTRVDWFQALGEIWHNKERISSALFVIKSVAILFALEMAALQFLAPPRNLLCVRRRVQAALMSALLLPLSSGNVLPDVISIDFVAPAPGSTDAVVGRVNNLQGLRNASDFKARANNTCVKFKPAIF